MTNGTVISKTEYNVLINKVERLEKTVCYLVEKLEEIFEKEPKYGTEKWWSWSIKKSEEEYKAGRYTTITNKKELKDFFTSL